MPLHSCRSKKATSGTGLYHPPYFDAESLLLFIAALHVLGYLVYQLPVDSPVFAFHLTICKESWPYRCMPLHGVKLISLCLDNTHFCPLSHISSWEVVPLSSLSDTAKSPSSVNSISYISDSIK